MAKDKTAYVCDYCGNESPKWIGKCPACGRWNTYKEIRVSSGSSSGVSAVLLNAKGTSKPTPLSEITSGGVRRIDMEDGELNRVLGGGLVKGSIILIGGEPGIGKSTLVLQTVLNLRDMKILYVSGEESDKQIKMRAERLLAQMEEGNSPGEPLILCETSLDNILAIIPEINPDILIIDSIQTLSTSSAESGPGSVTQIRECATSLLRYAKTSGTPVILIGHITKEGSIAGPKVLEHIVDAVLQFEGDNQYVYRILRCIKNRFGSTSELGIYEMTQAGLRQVANPSALLLSHAADGLSGIAISCAIEGMRPFLIETQALVSSSAYATPQRSATGFDQRRLNMLLAVLEKRVGFRLPQKDVFINIAGAMRVSDTAMDLAVIAAILSSNLDIAISPGWCMAGEVGLSGEVRPVARLAQRIAEAERLGYTDIIVPQGNMSGLEPAARSIRLYPVKRVEEALRTLFG